MLSGIVYYVHFTVNIGLVELASLSWAPVFLLIKESIIFRTFLLVLLEDFTLAVRQTLWYSHEAAATHRGEAF